MNKRRREEFNEERKIVMWVGQRRERGKGSEILEPSAFSRNGSIIRVSLDFN